MAKKKKGLIARIFTIIGSIIGSVITIAGIYVLYVVLSYHRIGDKALTVDAGASETSVKVGQKYTATSYNIGFGAYSQDFTFFMDTGYDAEGNPTCGHNSKAKSKEDVLFNINGAINAINDLDPDFIAFQEVDTRATRSHKINEDTMLKLAFSEMDHTHARNFDTAFLPYPLYDMHGASKAGLTTFSKVKVQEAMRKEYTVTKSFSKFFDLDRCFSYQKMNTVNGKAFYFVNSHMSAYDEGGTIRQAQVQELNNFLAQRKADGDYVVIAGDFNHDLLTYNPDFSYTKTNKPFGETKKDPDWVQGWFDQNGRSPLIDGYSVVASDNVPTCRNNDIEWIPGTTYTCTIDGFIVSNNIEVISHRNIQTKNGKKGLDGFAFSDHDPTMMEFKLKA